MANLEGQERSLSLLAGWSVFSTRLCLAQLDSAPLGSARLSSATPYFPSSGNRKYALARLSREPSDRLWRRRRRQSRALSLCALRPRDRGNGRARSSVSAGVLLERVHGTHVFHHRRPLANEEADSNSAAGGGHRRTGVGA